MRNTIKSRFAGICIMLVTCAVFGVAVMLLWNALMTTLFTLPRIGYLQAAGLLILARLLFGGIGGSHAGRIGALGAGEDRRMFYHGNKFREKWMNMSADERKEFVEKEKDFFKLHRGFSRFHEFFDEEKPEQGEDKNGN